ncbi:MAG: hypothetical protein ACMXYF_06065 [Candidatus Woesearchaeota archaeon]
MKPENPIETIPIPDTYAADERLRTAYVTGVLATRQPELLKEPFFSEYRETRSRLEPLRKEAYKSGTPYETTKESFRFQHGQKTLREIRAYADGLSIDQPMSTVRIGKGFVSFTHSSENMPSGRKNHPMALDALLTKIHDNPSMASWGLLNTDEAFDIYQDGARGGAFRGRMSEMPEIPSERKYE